MVRVHFDCMPLVNKIEMQYVWHTFKDSPCNLGCTPFTVLSFPGGNSPLFIKAVNNLKGLCKFVNSRGSSDMDRILLTVLAGSIYQILA